MIKKRILVVGFGKMGCRHVQALLQDKNTYDVHILEPSEKNISDNLLLINAQREHCNWYSSLTDLPILDMVIIATSSGPRFQLFHDLLKLGYRTFLLEKIVFQSEDQFNLARKLVSKHNGIVYCNFVSRYFDAYRLLKGHLDKSTRPVHITVHGGAFGLGCNAIHYLDMFQYLAADNTLFHDPYFLLKR